MTGLYVHIPFCVKKCHYCNFVTTGLGSPEKETSFIDSLEKESAHHRDYFRDRVFETLYFGGGTPSALSIEGLERIFSILRRDFRFRDGAEITLEANPESLSGDKAGVLRDLGVNRVSLGVQTFNDRTLERLNRAHTASQTVTSFEILRKEGFRNISLDLMLSLPGEILGDVRDSLSKAVRLNPEHVSLYELVVEEKTVFGKFRRAGTLEITNEEIQIQMLSFARQFLKDNHFYQYELLNYAKIGFESRHNLLYWDNREYLGLGPGAFSYFGGRRFCYSQNFSDYINKISAGNWSAGEEEALDGQKREPESFLLALRKITGAPIRRFESFVKKKRDLIEKLISEGLI